MRILSFVNTMIYTNKTLKINQRIRITKKKKELISNCSVWYSVVEIGPSGLIRSRCITIFGQHLYQLNIMSSLDMRGLL